MSLPRLLERAARPTLLLVDPAFARDALTRRRARRRRDPRLRGAPGDSAADSRWEDSRWACVVVAVPDRAACAATSRRCPGWVAPARWSPSSPRRRRRSCPTYVPEWPEVVELDAHLTSDGGAVTRLRFPSAVAVHEVLGRLGVDAGSPATAAHGGLVVGGDDGPDAQVPPDVLRGGAPSGHESAVTGRRAVVADPGPVVGRRGRLPPGRVPTRRDGSRGRPARRAGDRGDRGRAAPRPCGARDAGLDGVRRRRAGDGRGPAHGRPAAAVGARPGAGRARGVGRRGRPGRSAGARGAQRPAAPRCRRGALPAGRAAPARGGGRGPGGRAADRQRRAGDPAARAARLRAGAGGQADRCRPRAGAGSARVRRRPGPRARAAWATGPSSFVRPPPRRCSARCSPRRPRQPRATSC